VCKSKQLQCHKSGGNVHSWGLKDGVGIYLEEQVEATLRVSALLHFADIWRPANEDHGLWLDAQTQRQKLHKPSPGYKNAFTFLKGCSWYFQ